MKETWGCSKQNILSVISYHQIIGYHHETVQFAVSFSVLYTQFPKEKGNIIADNTLIQDPF